MSLNRTKERLFEALEKDPAILVPHQLLDKHQGFSLQYLETLGLTETDLKRLESHQAAKRGYRKITKETPGKATSSHLEVRWILLAD